MKPSVVGDGVGEGEAAGGGEDKALRDWRK